MRAVGASSAIRTCAFVLLFATAAHAALSADEKNLLKIKKTCPEGQFLSSWPLPDGIAACDKSALPNGQSITVVCNAKKQITELDFGVSPARSFSCLTPVLAKFKALKSLRFRGGGLNGTLPSAWGGLKNLQRTLAELSIYDHRLTGPLPARWGNLRHLQRLVISGRDCCLSKLDGPLPPIWGRLKRLKSLDLAFNRIKSTLPSEWRGMKAMIDMRLSVNDFYGPIPSSWTKMTHLQTLILFSVDGICGPIPKGLETKVQTFNPIPKTCPAS